MVYKKIFLFLIVGIFLISFASAIDISTCGELQAISNRTADYVLTNNIDCSDTINWGGGVGFLPLGTAGTNFSGSFGGTLDGQGYNITNLYINRTSGALNTGIFNSIQSITGSSPAISNLGLTDIYLRSDNTMGILVGDGQDLNIDNVFVTGTIETSAIGVDGVGAIAGYLYDSNLSNSWSNVSVNCNDDTSCGGLVGYSGAYIEKSFSLGSVTGSGQWIGGLVGYNDGTINNSFSLADVTGDDSVGGLIGILDVFVTGEVFNSYSAGSVTGNTNVGGLVGANNTDCSNSNSFWDTETSGQGSSACGTGKTTAQMKAEATFTSWDFTTIWNINEGVTYPYLFLNIFTVPLIYDFYTGIFDSTVPYTTYTVETIQSQAGQVANETTNAIAGATNWFPIIIVITVMVTLIVLTALIIIAFRNANFLGGTA